MKQKRAVYLCFPWKICYDRSRKKMRTWSCTESYLGTSFFKVKTFFVEIVFSTDQICLCRVCLIYTTFCLNQVAMISTAPHKVFDSMCLWEKNSVIWTSLELNPTQWMIALTVHLSASVIRHVFLWTWPRLEEWTESFGASCSLLTNTETPLNSLETRAPIISSLRLHIFFGRL